MANANNRRTPGGASAAPTVSRREALRQQQEAEAQRARRNKLVMALCGVLALLIIVGVVVVALNHKSSTTASGSQVTPPDAVDTVGIAVHPAGAKTAAANAPTLVEYQDYQCPACKEYFTVFGSILNQLVADGSIKLQYNTMTFLDSNLKNDSSTRAAIAADCADTVGAYEKYHDVVYTNQPTTEGQGYTDEQLRSTFAAQAGITGANLTKFQTCYDQKQTANFVKATEQAAEKAGISNTPTFQVNGSKLDLSKVNPTKAAVLAAITAANNGTK